MSDIKDVSEEFTRIQNERLTYYEHDMDSIITGEQFDLREVIKSGIGSGIKSFTNLVKAIGGYIVDRSKYISQFGLNMFRQYERLIKLQFKFKETIVLEGEDIDRFSKGLLVYNLANIDASLPNNLDSVYRFMFSITAKRVSKDLGVKIKYKLTGDSKLTNGDLILSLIDEKVVIEEKLGNISWPIYINKDKLKVLTFKSGRPTILNAGVRKNIAQSSKLKSIEADFANTMIDGQFKYLKIFDSKINKIVSVMVDIKGLLKDIEVANIDDENLKLSLVKDLEVMLKAGDTMLDYIDDSLSISFSLYNRLLHKYSNDDTKRRIKEVEE